MRIKIKGIWRVPMRLADGTKRVYYYAWREAGAPRLEGQPGSAAFIQSYNEAIAQRAAKPAREETLGDLFDLYLASNYYRKKAPRTQKEYAQEIAGARAKFGWVPLKLLGAKEARRDFYAHREELARKSGDRKADKFWTTLALTLAWGKSSGICDHNPCEKGGRFYAGSRIDKVWPFEIEQDFYRRGPKHLAEALLLAVWTGQRQADCLEMVWFQYDGRYIRLQQNKTEARVQIPVGGPLKVMLDEKRRLMNPRPGDRILLTSEGRPWTSSGFQSSWRKASKKLGIGGLTFNDLRGTAVTRLALAACSVPQIATFTGHSLKDVQAILDAHYLARDPALAEDALKKLEAFWSCRTIASQTSAESAARTAGASIVPLARPSDVG